MVDDNQNFNETMCDRLEIRGHQFLSAYSGAEALDQLEKEEVDLVLIDIRLPDFSGVDLLEKVKELYPDIGCIMVTGYSSKETAIQSLNLAAEGYLTKPIDSVDLFETVEKAARKREKRLYEEKLENLNQILRTIRTVNQLIVREQKSEDLMQKICELLIESRVYHCAWIALFNDKQISVDFYPTGLDDEFGKIIEKVDADWLPQCIERGLEEPGVHIIENPVYDCGDCPLAENYKDRSSIFTQISYRDKTYGVLVISSPRSLAWKEERSLLQELTTDIGYALNNLELKEEKEEHYRLLQEKDQELQKLNQKLKVVGSLTRHDVQNKLSTVSDNLYLTEKQLSNRPEVQDYLEDIKTAVNQATRILDFSRTYEQLGAQELQEVDVGQAVEDTVHYYYSELKAAGIEVENRCQGLTVKADQMLPRLFYNLIQNTLQHAGEEASEIRVYYQETEGDGIKMVYKDDGVGIPEEEKEKVFQEGYGRDTGYGLYLIRKMCEVYGWTIKETGTTGEGARLTITIPRNKIEE